MPTLILTPRYTADAQALWRAAVSEGWRVERLTGWRVPAHLAQVPEPVLYVEALFGPTLAQQLGFTLLDPPPRLAGAAAIRVPAARDRADYPGRNSLEP